MSEQNRDQWENEKSSEPFKQPEEEYTFMQEVIKDEAGSKKKNRKDVIRMIWLGVLFGAVAAFVFCIVKYGYESFFKTGTKVEVAIEDDAAEDSTEDDQGKDEVSGQEDEELVLSKLTAAANRAQAGLVTVTCKMEATADTKAESENFSGAIIADNGKQLLVLATQTELKTLDKVQIKVHSGHTYDGERVMSYKELGISVYAIEKMDLTQNDLGELRALQFGNSNNLEETYVAACGKPFGSDEAVSYGRVEAVTAYNMFADGIYNIVRTDISSETIGSGVLLNDSGKIVGLIVKKAEQTEGEGNVSAFSISDMTDVIENLSNANAIPYMGMVCADVTDEMENSGVPKGVYVKKVAADSPAMLAGIQVGDVLTRFGTIGIYSEEEYHTLLMQADIGAVVHMKVKRLGTKAAYVDMECDVEVGRN